MNNFKVYTTSNKSLGQTAASAWKCPKTQFWGPLIENLNPLQDPTHTLTPSLINTLNRSHMDLSQYALTSLLQVKTLKLVPFPDPQYTLPNWGSGDETTLKRNGKQGFGYPGFQKNSRHTHQNRIGPVLEWSAYPLQTMYASLRSPLG